jgi:hypothetical protein
MLKSRAEQGEISRDLQNQQGTQDCDALTEATAITVQRRCYCILCVFIDFTHWFSVMLHDLEKLRQHSIRYGSFSVQGCQSVLNTSVFWACVL